MSKDGNLESGSVEIESQSELESISDTGSDLESELESKSDSGSDSNEEEEEEISSESDVNEDDDGHIPSKVENQLLNTLIKIREKDPSIYNKEAKFYSTSSDSEDDDASEKGGQETSKPMYLKDVQAKQLLEEGADAYASSDGDEEQDYESSKHKLFGYDEAQRKLRANFLAASTLPENDNNDEDDNELFGGLKVVQKDPKNDEKDGSGDKEMQNLLDKYFGRVENDKDDEFLKDYILNKRWVVDGSEEESEEGNLDDQFHHTNIDQVDLNEEEEHLEKADAFEATYNFRFEEPGSEQIVSYPRFVDESVRKSESKRKRQRERKKGREAARKLQQEDEVRRKKNLKKQEIESKLKELSEAAGNGAPSSSFLTSILKDDFKIEDWDKIMETAYGDEYYKVEDEDYGVDSGDEDCPDHLDDAEAFNGELEQDEEDGVDAKRQKVEDESEIVGDECDDADEAMVDDEQIQELVNQYYKLDYEDDIAGVKTRYKYISVPKDSYGLKSEEVIMLDDKQLNEFVGMKRLDPYRDDKASYKVNPWKLRKLKESIEWDEIDAPDELKEHAENLTKHSKKGFKKNKGGSKAWMKKKDSGQSGSKNGQSVSVGEDNVEATKKAARLASFSTDSLWKGKKDDEQSLNKKKRKHSARSTEPVNKGPKLTKAQKRNLRRSRKRAE